MHLDGELLQLDHAGSLNGKELTIDAVTSVAPNTSLRQRMLQDMKIRGFGEHTQKDYTRHVRRFAAFLGQPPDTATVEYLRRFKIDQHERAVGPATINGAVSALRLLYTILASHQTDPSHPSSTSRAYCRVLR